jgi:hypothetical protein
VSSFRLAAIMSGVHPEPSWTSESKERVDARRRTMSRWLKALAQWIGRRSSSSRRLASFGLAARRDSTIGAVMKHQLHPRNVEWVHCDYLLLPSLAASCSAYLSSGSAMVEGLAGILLGGGWKMSRPNSNKYGWQISPQFIMSSCQPCSSRQPCPTVSKGPTSPLL